MDLFNYVSKVGDEVSDADFEARKFGDSKQKSGMSKVSIRQVKQIKIFLFLSKRVKEF